MPYIKKEDRERIEKTGEIKTVGELNYAITKDLIKCINTKATEESLVELGNSILESIKIYIESKKQLRYSVINDAIGAIYCAGYECADRLVQLPDIETVAKSQAANAIFLLLSDAADKVYTLYAVDYEAKKLKENGDVGYDKLTFGV